MTYTEISLEGLPGPTHHFGGLAKGDLASMTHKDYISYPKKAAIQCLEKMRVLDKLGIKQIIYPPALRPDLAFLHQLGFSGTAEELVQQVFVENASLLSAVFSASSMWVANAATLTPSLDTADNKCHITPANLVTNLHRTLEVPHHTHILKKIFVGDGFVHHPALPAQVNFADEGAANSMRLAKSHNEPGIHVFVYDRTGHADDKPSYFPKRQTLYASKTIARRHQVNHPYFLKQNPNSILQGIFHNDVIATANENVLIYHEKAFNERYFIKPFNQFLNNQLMPIMIPEQLLPIPAAVKSYFFNSQLVTKPNNTMHLVSPLACKKGPVHDMINGILKADNPINGASYIDVSESLNNGGGPACLRNRILLNEQEIKVIPDTVWYHPALHEKLTAIIDKYYPDSFSLSQTLTNDTISRLQTTQKKILSVLDLL